MSLEATVAKPMASESGHWYTKSGEACYEQPKKDGSGNRPTTLRDARKLKLLPSVTTILRVLDKPALTYWLIEQAVLTAVTAPRLPDEALDAFIERVLHTERQQDAESQKARDLGTDVHAAIEQAVSGKSWDISLGAFVAPVLEALKPFGEMIATEKIVVGNGYAGKTDYLARGGGFTTMVDFKTGKKLPPKESYPEHRIQLGGYIAALEIDQPYQIYRSVNIYINTTTPGEIKVFENIGWREEAECFMHLFKVWQHLNQYNPNEL